MIEIGLFMNILFFLANYILHNVDIFFLQRTKRQTISEEEAINLCENDFQQSAYYNTCLQIVPNFSNETFVNCISDLTVLHFYFNYFMPF